MVASKCKRAKVAKSIHCAAADDIINLSEEKANDAIKLQTRKRGACNSELLQHLLELLGRAVELSRLVIESVGSTPSDLSDLEAGL